MTREEYGELYEKNFNFTVTTLMHCCTLPYGDASELAQDAWAKGWERISQLRCPEKALAWVVEIGKNIFKSAVRRKTRRQITFEPLNGFERAILPNTTARLEAEKLLSMCKPTQKQALVLHYLLGYRENEMRKMLSTSSSAVKLRIHHGKEKIRENLNLC